MFELSEYELIEYVKEDLPYLDFTTFLQKAESKITILEIFTREDIVVACTEEASKIAKLLNCKTIFMLKSQQKAKKNDILISIQGDYSDIHKAWKLCQVLLEYTCKMATYSNQMLEEIRKVNNKCQILGTRKTFPFSKKLCIKSIIAGGAMPHRLGLSDSVLFFEQHRVYYKNNESFYSEIEKFKRILPEKKIVVETNSKDDALNLMKNGIDVLQLDKVNLELTKEIIEIRNQFFENIKIISAGGINLKNARDYAQTGIDAIVTSAVYTQGLADLSSKINLS